LFEIDFMFRGVTSRKTVFALVAVLGHCIKFRMRKGLLYSSGKSLNKTLHRPTFVGNMKSSFDPATAPIGYVIGSNKNVARVPDDISWISLKGTSKNSSRQLPTNLTR
jgi:hypothetical protein